MKKLTAILLCVLLLAGTLPVAAFAAGGTCDCGKAPRILIDGINSCRLVKDAGTPEETEAFALSPEAILGLVKDNKEAIFDALDGRLSQESIEALTRAVIGMFDACSMNPDGTSHYEILADWHYATDDRHQSGGVYHFTYDWRLDPYLLAQQLKAYIDYIKQLTGHDKVQLIGFSLGSCVMDTYLREYGLDDVAGCIWHCGAYRGVEMVNEIFTGRLQLDPAAVNGFVAQSTDNSFGFQMLTALLDGLKAIGIESGVLGVANKVLNTLVESGAMREVLLGTFGRMPTLWSFVDDSCFEQAKDWLFPTDADRETYAGLIEKIDRYHYEVQAHVDEIMEEVRMTTGRIGVISKYNMYQTPVVAEGDLCSDGIIDTFHTSGGATAARLGKTLGDDYKQAVDDGFNHLSADGMIDASTCRYPMYTWFIKNLEHSNNRDCVYRLFDFILSAETQPDVSTDPAFPQFLVYSKTTDSVKPLTSDRDGLEDMKFIQRVHAFFSRIIVFFRRLFSGKLFA